jgi:hypothetical protein
VFWFHVFGFGLAGTTPTRRLHVCRFCNQVTKDWFVGVGLDEFGMANPAAVATLHARSSAFLAPREVVAGKAKAKSAPRFQKAGQPNVEMMRALDHALNGIGSCLADFACPGKPKALDEACERYFVDAKELPAKFASNIGFKTRSCIVNKVTGHRRFEVSWLSERRVLAECIDAGPIGLAARHFLHQAGDIRGLWTLDPPHVRHDHYLGAVRRAGFIDVFHEARVIIGLRKGPWSGAAHHQTMKQVIHNLRITSNPDDLLFGYCLSGIINDTHKGRPPSFCILSG